MTVPVSNVCAVIDVAAEAVEAGQANDSNDTDNNNNNNNIHTIIIPIQILVHIIMIRTILMTIAYI